MTHTARPISHGGNQPLVPPFVGCMMLALLGCADLPLIEANECGNRVVEPGEDCDGQPTCGAKGTTQACRFTCSWDVDEPLDCPAGFGCGVDGICRQASGKVEIVFAGTTDTLRDLQVGDINSDHCAEMIRTTTRGEVVVTAFPSAAAGYCVASQQELRATGLENSQQPSPAPLLVDLTNDDQPELVVATEGFFDSGLLVYTAYADPTFSPFIYPNVRMAEANIKTLTVRQPISDVLLIVSPDNKAYLIDNIELKPVPETQSLMGTGDFVILKAADLDVTPVSQTVCEEVVIGHANQGSIDIYQTCDSNGNKKLTHLSKVTLAQSATLRDWNQSLLLVDQNNDGNLDLLLNTTKDKLQISYGLGDGRFHSMPPPLPLPMGFVPDQMASEWSAPNPPGDEVLTRPENFLVLVDFDPMNPGPEFVPLPCPKQDTPFASPLCAANPDRTCHAVVVDIDADGDEDIVASDGQEPDLVVFRNVDGGFNVTTLETQCPPDHLVSGDVDGDGIMDVAFFDQFAPEPDKAITTLSIAYGNAMNPPTSPVQQGQLQDAIHLAAGRFFQDDMISVGVSHTQLFAARSFMGMPAGPDMAQSALALLEGRSERLMLSPFYFPAPMQDPEAIIPSTLLAFTTGLFSTDMGKLHQGIAAITDTIEPMGPTKKLWLIRGDREAANLGGKPQSPMNEVSCNDCVLVAAHVNGDEYDELLILGDSSVGNPEILVNEYDASEDTFVETHRFPSGFAFLALEGSNPPKYAPRPLVADLDGDGNDDIIARATTGEIVALWRQPDESFQERVIATPPACVAEKTCGGLSMALVNADTDAALELIIIGPNRLDLYEIDAQRRDFMPIGAPQIEVEGDQPFKKPLDTTDFTALASGDLDGDGVQDVVLAPSSSFYLVLRGVPKNP